MAWFEMWVSKLLFNRASNQLPGKNDDVRYPFRKTINFCNYSPMRQVINKYGLKWLQPF